MNCVRPGGGLAGWLGFGNPVYPEGSLPLFRARDQVPGLVLVDQAPWVDQPFASHSGHCWYRSGGLSAGGSRRPATGPPSAACCGYARPIGWDRSWWRLRRPPRRPGRFPGEPARACATRLSPRRRPRRRGRRAGTAPAPRSLTARSGRCGRRRRATTRRRVRAVGTRGSRPRTAPPGRAARWRQTPPARLASSAAVTRPRLCMSRRAATSRSARMPQFSATKCSVGEHFNVED